jgi:hypothetical protein
MSTENHGGYDGPIEIAYTRLRVPRQVFRIDRSQLKRLPDEPPPVGETVAVPQQQLTEKIPGSDI